MLIWVNRIIFYKLNYFCTLHMEEVMRGKIPKTELLVTFEVVARHESYTRAAEELALTQSAVFRQVNALEDFLNTALFNHAKKRIFLNAAGKGNAANLLI